MYHNIQEGKAEIHVPKEGKVSKELPVFYNSVMQFNRDVTLAFLASIPDIELQVCDLLAGTGVRSIRLLKELPSAKIQSIMINDGSSEACSLIEKNLDLNGIQYRRVESDIIRTRGRNDTGVYVTNEDANLLLLYSSGFDYIDIDPFGSPNPFLNNAISRISRDGILAVTATDTSALCGTYLNACKRKYWAVPSRGPLMHETGLRILIRKVQLIGAQFDKALIPLYSYSRDHYMRVFFRAKKGKEAVDLILKEHGMLGNIGPLYLGKLWDSKIATSVAKKLPDPTTQAIAEESRIDAVGFYSLAWYAKKLKLPYLPKQSDVIKAIKTKKHNACATHFAPNALRSTLEEKEFVALVKKMIR